MKTLAAIIVMVALMAVTAPALAAQPQARHAGKAPLTVKITKADGVVWGKVKVSPLGTTCSAKTCNYAVIKGKKQKFSETPQDTTTWPFCRWKVNGKKKSTSTTLSVKVSSATTVMAVYTLPDKCQ